MHPKGRSRPGGGLLQEPRPSSHRGQKESSASENGIAVARLERPKLYAMDMLDVLKRIAAGHNDPQKIANEIVSKIENG
jgi:hypothetical protein